MSPKFGTLEWSKINNGVLTPTERLHFLRNMAFLAAREASDAIRDRLRLLKPADLNLSHFAPPDTRMAKDAEVFARETHTLDLLSHGYRSYYFGAILASYSKLKYDKELYFTAALLHDIGLTDSRAVPLKECCFAVTGGRQIHDFLICKGHPPVSNACPYIVGSIPRGPRSKSFTPIANSRSAITSDTVGAETLSCAAALAMLPTFATVKNTCRSRNLRRRPIWLSQSTFFRIGKTPMWNEINREFS
jgi:hypothetical protein